MVGLLGLFPVFLIFAGAPSAHAAPLAGANVDLDMVCTQGNTGYTDYTGAANNDLQDDLPLGSAGFPTEPTSVYFGMSTPFDELRFLVGGAGTGSGAIEWSYWNGQYWAALSVDDNTNNFKSTGAHSVEFSAPPAWAQKGLGVGCSGERYWIQANTATMFAAAPWGTQVSALVYNVRVHVDDEIGRPMEDLTQDDFAVTGGTTNTIYGLRSVGDGDYDLALDINGLDHEYDVRVSADGYVKSGALSTGPLSEVPRDLRDPPLVLAYGFKVAALRGDGDQHVPGATVAAGNDEETACEPHDEAWYCPVPVEDTTLTVRATKPGHVPALGVFPADRASAGDPQRSTEITGFVHTLKITVQGVATLDGVQFEQRTGASDFATVTPAWIDGNDAYFAQDVDASDLVYRATKGTQRGDTGTPFGVSDEAQTRKTITLAAGAGLAAPAGLTADGLVGDLLAAPPLDLRWDPVPGAVDYAVYVGATASYPLDDEHRVGTTAAVSFRVATLTDGRYHYTVVARNDAEAEGDAASLEVLYDTLPPTSTVEAPAEAGPALAVHWLATDAGAGIDTIQVWVREEGGEPRLLRETDQAEGTLAFYGVPGHSYTFSTLAIDALGKVEQAAANSGDSVGERVTKIVTDRNVASESVQVLLGRSVGVDPVYVVDETHDGVPDLFVDPAGQLESLGILANDVQEHIVVVKLPTSDLPKFVWDPARNEGAPVVETRPLTAPVVGGTRDRPEVVVAVDKTGWICIVVEDLLEDHPIERVLRADGSEIATGFYWRHDGVVAILDDPSQEYRVVYGPAPSSGTAWWLYVAVGAAFVGLAVWFFWFAHRRRRKAHVARHVPTTRAAPLHAPIVKALESTATEPEPAPFIEVKRTEMQFGEPHKEPEDPMIELNDELEALRERMGKLKVQYGLGHVSPHAYATLMRELEEQEARLRLDGATAPVPPRRRAGAASRRS